MLAHHHATPPAPPTRSKSTLQTQKLAPPPRPPITIVPPPGAGLFDHADSSLHILELPTGILTILSAHLTTSSLISMKLTCRALYNTLPIPLDFKPSALDTCTRTAIRHYLEEQAQAPSRYRCALCKTLYPRSLFEKARCLDPGDGLGAMPPSRDDIGRTTNFARDGAREKLRGPRICYWHVPRFVRDLRSVEYRSAYSIVSYLDEPGDWIYNVQKECMHCGKVVGGVECICECESCGVRELRCWWRIER